MEKVRFVMTGFSLISLISMVKFLSLVLPKESVARIQILYLFLVSKLVEGFKISLFPAIWKLESSGPAVPQVRLGVLVSSGMSFGSLVIVMSASSKLGALFSLTWVLDNVISVGARLKSEQSLVS